MPVFCSLFPDFFSVCGFEGHAIHIIHNFPHAPQPLCFQGFQQKSLFLFLKLYAIISFALKKKKRVKIMGRLTLYNDSNTDTTLVSNRFIDEYMKDANDAQLKVYLYLIRMFNAHLATSIDDIAEQFNHTEREVVRALKYWEKLKLLNLDYDEQGNVSGIHIQDLDKMPSAQIVPLKNHKTSPNTVTAETPVRPSYSPDQIRAYKDNEDFSRILFISEQYLQRPLSASDIQTFLFIYDSLHLSVDLVDYLVEYCVEHHKTNHLYIEKVALDWASSNIRTVEQAKAHASHYNKDVYTIMKALGNHNAPTQVEADMVRKWTDTFAFSIDIILKACERSVLATAKNRLRYTDSILESWYNSGVKRLCDIDALDSAHAKKTSKQETRPAARTGHPNTFNQFEQRSYDFDALERELLSN